MRYVLLTFCAMAFVNCSDKGSSGPANNNPSMRGSFIAEKEVDVSMKQQGCDPNVTADMDSRIQKGQSFSTVRQAKEYEQSAVETSSEDLDILDVNHDENFIKAKLTLRGRGMTGWIIGKRQYSFSNGYSGWNFEIEKVSPNLQQLWAKSQKEEDDGNEVWHSCIVDYSKSTTETKIEDGTFTFAGGKSVKAQRESTVRSGAIECIKMQSVKDQAPLELAREKVGNGSSTQIHIYTTEIPSLDSYTCGRPLMELYSKDEEKLEDGSLLILRTEELTNYR